MAPSPMPGNNPMRMGNPAPDRRNAAPIDEENVQIDEDFDQNQSGVEHAIGIENQRDRDGEG